MNHRSHNTRSRPTNTRLRTAVISLLWAALVASAALITLPATSEASTKQIPNGSTVIDFGSRWQYSRSSTEPEIAWQYSAKDLGWPQGQAPLGYGSADLGTALDPMADQPLITYFRTTFTLKKAKAQLPNGAYFTTYADDGVLVYVNGHEIGRKRLAAYGYPGLSWSTADWYQPVPGGPAAPITTQEAKADAVIFTIPAEYLTNGDNVISVAVLAAKKDTADIYFDGQLTAGSGGQAPPTQGLNPNLKLVWHDEFNGTSLNRSYWTPEDLSHFGDGGKQTECLMDRPENLAVSGGNLVITARREPTPLTCGDNDPRFPGGRNFSSAHISTWGKMEFTYGRLEMRAKIPVGQATSQGLWPAFWLRPADDTLGEIDVLEALGSKPGGDYQAGIVHQAAHRDYEGTPHKSFNYLMPQGGTMDDGFHTYAMEWTPTELRWYVDGVQTWKVNAENASWYSDAFVGRDFFIRINMAVGGSWPGQVDDTTQLPAQYLVDYVRLYQ